jgi:hypothetical protein
MTPRHIADGGHFRYTKYLSVFVEIFMLIVETEEGSEWTRINLSQDRHIGGVFERGNKPAVPIRCVKFLYKLGNY